MRIRQIAAMAPLVFLLPACDSGPPLAPAKGIVLRGGQPFKAKLLLRFYPEDGGHSSTAVTDAAGRFEVKFTRDTKGAIVGRHKVTVEFKPADAKAEMEFAAGTQQYHPDQAEIVDKFGKRETTPLTVEIVPGNNELTLKLD